MPSGDFGHWAAESAWQSAMVTAPGSAPPLIVHSEPARGEVPSEASTFFQVTDPVFRSLTMAAFRVASKEVGLICGKVWVVVFSWYPAGALASRTV